MNIICLIGRSASGKNTIKKWLLDKSGLNLKEIVPATTHPKRPGEIDLKTYVFYNDVYDFMQDYMDKKIIEYRVYNTVNGKWFYGTPLPDDPDADYLIECSIDMYENIERYAVNSGNINVYPIYISVDEETLIKRALDRECKTKKDFAEMCRRFKSEHEEYTKERLKDLMYVENKDLKSACDETKNLISAFIKK